MEIHWTLIIVNQMYRKLSALGTLRILSVLNYHSII
jgi:hypothetical protein